MSKTIAFIIDPIETLNPTKDTSLYLMQAAIELGHRVVIATMDDCFIQNGAAYATLTQMTDAQNRITAETNTHPLSDCDIILMRKDPPFNMRYIYMTYLLELAEQAGSLVLNNPQSLRDCNEKLFITHFPQCITDTLVTTNNEALYQFLETHDKIVIKGLDSMGGEGVSSMALSDFHKKDEAMQHLSQLTDTQGLVMAQRFLPEVYEGDKRIILLNGEPLPYAVVRFPKENDFRANLAQGGSYKIAPLSERDQWLCQQLKETLIAKGLFFVGLDVIGDHISEINVTSPTCLRELDKDSPLNPAELFWSAIL